VSVTLYEGIGELPHFNPDLDAEGMAPPPAVAQLKKRLADADALLISTPEYAHGIPGVLKNALDWLVSGAEMPGKPVGIVYGSAGDASHARAALTEVLTTMSARVILPAVVSVPGAGTLVGPQGEVSDPETARLLRGVLDALRVAARG
jgi:NAD(P)H-dependent FMN reductase